MNEKERIKLVKAMEYIARQCNDETVFDYWLTLGVADGDINYGDLTDEKNGDVDYYIDDDTFAELMYRFLVTMKFAKDSGGLHCDGIVSSV